MPLIVGDNRSEVPSPPEHANRKKKGFSVYDFEHPDQYAKEGEENTHKQHLVKGIQLKEPNIGQKYKFHSVYGESIKRKQDVIDEADEHKSEFYDSKYRTFIKEKDSDEEQSRDGTVSKHGMRRMSTKGIEFVPTNFDYDEELKPIIENESQRDIDEDASPHKRRL